MPSRDDERLDKTPTRRLSDVQMGVIIERVRNIEKHMIDLGVKFDHWTDKFEQQCNTRHLDVSKVIVEVKDKASKEQFEKLKDTVQNHTTYWGLLFGVITLGSGLAYTIFKLIKP